MRLPTASTPTELTNIVSLRATLDEYVSDPTAVSQPQIEEHPEAVNMENARFTRPLGNNTRDTDLGKKTCRVFLEWIMIQHTYLIMLQQ